MLFYGVRYFLDCNNDPASSSASRAHSKLSFRSPSEENILQEEEATSDDDDDTSSMTSNLTNFTVRTNAATSAIDTNRMCDLEQQFATLQKKMDLLLKLQQNAQPQNSTEVRNVSSVKDNTNFRYCCVGTFRLSMSRFYHTIWVISPR